MKRLKLHLLITLFLVTTLTPHWAAAAPNVDPPPGFQLSIYASGLNLPVDMAIMPDGGLLVAEKGSGFNASSLASVRLVRNGLLQPLPVLNLSTNSSGDSGINGIVLDPAFTANGWFYLWHASGVGSTGWAGQSVMRLTRYTFDPLTETADPASEVIILDGVMWALFHNGGGLAFAPDGNLFIATGDANAFTPSQNMASLNGKLLRITPTATGYTIPADNPFIGVPDARPEIYALGLRNPWRITIRETDGQLYIGDVGFYIWEELNLALPGANYGWPVREGPCPIGQIQPCAPAPPQFTDPILYYLHPQPTGGSAITGVAFYAGVQFPSGYADLLFFADVNQRFIATTDLTNLPVVDGEFTIFAEPAGSFVSVEYFDDRLYFLDVYTGKIFRLEYTDAQVPTAILGADVTQGGAPLPVNFTAQGSTVLPGTTPTFLWDFGDGGGPISTPGSTISHTYTLDGNYQATLIVQDNAGGLSSPASLPITVYSGEMPQIQLDNLTEPGRTLFHGGDGWQYTALRSTLTDLDPDTPFTWQIDLNHNQHTHPILNGQAAISSTLAIPADDHGGSIAISYSFNLTMLTDQGIRVTISETLLPEVVTLTLTTDPTTPEQTSIMLNNISHITPYVFPSIVGTAYTAAAPSLLFYQQGVYLFDFWDGGDPGNPILNFATPPLDATLTAHYRYTGPAYMAWFPILVNEAPPLELLNPPHPGH